MAHAGGRPLKFSSFEEIDTLAQAYFDATPVGERTITGLALALDTSRSTLCDYEGKDEFSNTVKKWKEMVEHDYELSLRKRGSAGDIFGLKNFGWKDRHDVTTNDKDLPQAPTELTVRIDKALDEL